MDAVNVGLAAMHKVPEEELKESVLVYVRKYGFLGFMTALPTTADFIIYESVYLPKNHFIKEESLSTEDFLSYFYLLISWIPERICGKIRLERKRVY